MVIFPQSISVCLSCRKFTVFTSGSSGNHLLHCWHKYIGGLCFNDYITVTSILPHIWRPFNHFHWLLICLVSAVVFLISPLGRCVSDWCHGVVLCSGSDKPRFRSSQRESSQTPWQPCSWRPSPDSWSSLQPEARAAAVTRAAVGGQTANRLDAQMSLIVQHND